MIKTSQDIEAALKEAKPKHEAKWTIEAVKNKYPIGTEKTSTIVLLVSNKQEVSIGEMEMIINQAKAGGGTHLCIFQSKDDGEFDSMEISYEVPNPETPEQYEARITSQRESLISYEQIQLLWKLNAELDEYNKFLSLKKKYED